MRSLALSLSACVAAAALVLLPIAAAERVQATGAELADAISQPLLTYANASHDDGLRTVIVNGARLWLRSGATADGIDTVLDAQRGPCRPRGAEHNPIVHIRRADQGLIGCIVPQRGQSRVESVRALFETQDLAALGELRVTWAMSSRGGTRYVAIASDGPLELLRMFPEDGDAPGIDVPGLPRPPRARRLLSARQEGAAPLLLSYQSSLALGELEARYIAALGEDVRRVPGMRPRERALWVRRGESQYLAVLAADGRQTLISIVPLSGDATARVVAR